MGHQPIDNIEDINLVYPFLDTLCEKAEELLQTRDRILVTVVGKAGTGKSTFGRAIRKRGLGRFPPSQVCVIDDSRMSLDVFGIFRRKLRFRTPPEPDELKPFFDLIPKRKRIVVFMSKNPARRISSADLILHLKVDNDVRIRQLADRLGGVDRVPAELLDPCETDDFRVKAGVTMEGWVRPIAPGK